MSTGGGDEGLVFAQVELSLKVYVGCSSEYVHIFTNMIECVYILTCVLICLFMLFIHSTSN